jgi:integrating conjugative element protein, PFL_4709 family
LVSGLAVANLAWPQTPAGKVQVEVFTGQLLPAAGLGDGQGQLAVVAYDLSAADRLADGLSEGLPADAEAAASIARQRFSGDQSVLAGQVAEAFQGHGLALSYGLTSYPALVFNQEAVVYGTTDLALGLAQYRRWQQQQGQP